MKNIVLVGGGGHCKAVIDVAEQAGFTVVGILDVADNVGKNVSGHPITGTDGDIGKYAGKAEFIVTVGHIKSASLRVKLQQEIKEKGGRLATLVSPMAYVSKSARVGEGSVVMHKALVNAGAVVGDGCIINTLADVEHDARIGDFCHVSTGAMVNGGCVIGRETFLGSRSVLVNGISVAAKCVIAAGSVVTKDIVSSGLYMGNPAIAKNK